MGGGGGGQGKRSCSCQGPAEISPGNSDITQFNWVTWMWSVVGTPAGEMKASGELLICPAKEAERGVQESQRCPSCTRKPGVLVTAGAECIKLKIYD